MIAYRFGAIFLAMPPPDGPGRPDQADRAAREGPRAPIRLRWQFAHDLGFIHYWYTGDYEAAAGWFERAARLPRAPEWIGPLAATTKAQGGNREGARQMLGELLTGSSEEYIRNAAERGLRQLNALDAIDELQRPDRSFRPATRPVSDRLGGARSVTEACRSTKPASPFIVRRGRARRRGSSPDSPLQPLPRPLR